MGIRRTTTLAAVGIFVLATATRLMADTVTWNVGGGAGGNWDTVSANWTPDTANRNDGTDEIVGTFAGLPDGTRLILGTKPAMISYFGDTGMQSFSGGNDVVLQIIPEPASALLLGLAGLVLLRRTR